MCRFVMFLVPFLFLISLRLEATDTVVANPTYVEHVAPILIENCIGCHRPGDIAPMSLRTYKEVRPWAKSIIKKVRDRKMPPWHADPGFGPFKNEQTLTQHEIDTIVKWVNSGARRGNPAKMPPIKDDVVDEWTLGEPDHIVQTNEHVIGADGRDQFIIDEIETGFTEDKWVKAVEVLPGNRNVLHHMILRHGLGNPSEWLSLWVAGNRPTTFPEGMGRLLKAGTKIGADIHYHPVDTDESDTTRIGLYFAEEDEIKNELVNVWVVNADFVIPAGDEYFEARSNYTFPHDIHIVSMTPHMHYRGKDFSIRAIFPQGGMQELLRVSNYDFNWQTTYVFETPFAAPKGTKLECIAHWDNSENNPDNPNPTRDVRFGNDSHDEMLIGFVDYIVDDDVRSTANEDE